jgi:hypothetical protein
MLVEADGAYMSGSREWAFLISGSGHWGETVTRWSRREFTFSAIWFVAVSRPSFVHGCHNDQGGQSEPSSFSFTNDRRRTFLGQCCGQ